MFKNFFFDYIFYRSYQINGNKDGYQWVAASIIVSLIQSELISGIVSIIVRSIYDRSVTAPHSKQITSIGVTIAVTIMIFNFKKYHEKYSSLEDRWKDELRAERRLKGWLIILTAVLSFAPLIIIGVWF